MSKFAPYDGEKPYIFISYAHKDAAVVNQMIAQMIDDGYRVWYDEGIHPGTNWDEFIASKIKGCSMLIAFLSENYLASDNCRDELNFSRDCVDNLLLVYIEPVSLPAGMEMRFGRIQAIPAYEYTNKSMFFEKLYLSRGILSFCDKLPSTYVEFNPVEEITYDEQTFEEQVYEEEPELVIEAVVPNIEPPKMAVPTPKLRVEEEDEEVPADNRKYFIGIAVAAVLFIVAIVIIIVIATNAIKKNSEATATTATAEITREAEETTTEATTTVAATSESEETTTSETTEGTTTTSETTEFTEHDAGPVNPFAPYNLTNGETYYNTEYPSFFNNTGAVYIGFNEGDECGNGVFRGTDTMSIRVPVEEGFSETVCISWYYEDSEGNITCIYSINGEIPEFYNDEMNYISIINARGSLQNGTYYVAIADPDTGDDLTVSRVYFEN